MQQNQIVLILLQVAGNKNSCFKDNLKLENLYVSTFFIQPMILKKKCFELKTSENKKVKVANTEKSEVISFYRENAVLLSNIAGKKG